MLRQKKILEFEGQINQYRNKLFSTNHTVANQKLNKLEFSLKLLKLTKMANGFFPVLLINLKAHSQVWNNFWQLTVLWKWWKMVFISTQKIFSFSRCLTFCLNLLVMAKNDLIRKINLFQILWCHSLVNKHL